MHWFAQSTDWTQIFAPTTPLLETFVRGTVVYLALFLMLRFIAKREAGTMGITDMLVLVLIADAAQNAMAGSYTSISDGLLLVATIIGWSTVLNFLSFRFKTVERIIKPSRLLLIKDGRLMRRNMRQEFITEKELMSEVRAKGIDHVAQVKEASIEPDGTISLIPYEGRDVKEPKQKQF